MVTNVHDISSQGVISEILELGYLCHGGEDIKKVLDLLVEKITHIFRADVCSLYLLDPQSKLLVLKATKGLNQSAVDQVKMKISEGLVGKTFELIKPVSMSTGHKSKQFKFIAETGEERFSSFLSVPLIYNRTPIGVLVVQNEKAIRYSSQEIHLLMTLAIPVVSVIEKAKMLDTFVRISSQKEGMHKDGKPGVEQKKRQQGMMHVGIGAAPGIAIAKVCLVHTEGSRRVLPQKKVPIHIDVEKMRVLEAFRWVEEEILDIQNKATKKFGMEELSIFDAYRMVLESKPFKDQILQEIEQGQSALEAVEKVISEYTEELSLADDEYIKERTFDIHDVGRKISDRLLYGSNIPKRPYDIHEPAILLSSFWSITDFVEMDTEKIKGILSPAGGASSHIAILAESLGIPTVLGLSSFADLIRDGDEIVMDGGSGVIVLNPSPEAKKFYEKEIEEDKIAQKKYLLLAHKQAIPQGGKRIIIGANMGITSRVKNAIDHGAEEIGLYRTELPFLIRRSLPTEEEQYALYCKILSAMGSRPVTIRTLDIGGDKYVPYLNLPREANPFLGWRSIRISLEREDLFRIQLRALLRASTRGKLRLLFPMISSLDEIRRVNEIVNDVKGELRRKKVSYASKIPIGIMIEVPSAVEIAESLIKEVQFFSIGTNDLIQYTLAVDRNNPKVASLYNPFHPAVLRLIARTVRVAQKAGKPVHVCGEMASQAFGIIVLMGMGVCQLSMSIPLISKMKNFVSRLHYPEVKRLTARLLKLDLATQITNELEEYVRKKDLIDFLPHPKPTSLN